MLFLCLMFLATKTFKDYLLADKNIEIVKYNKYFPGFSYFFWSILSNIDFFIALLLTLCNRNTKLNLIYLIAIITIIFLIVSGLMRG